MSSVLHRTAYIFAIVAFVDSVLAQQEPLRRQMSPSARPTSLDAAVAIIAWDEHHNQIAEKMSEALKPVVDAIASGAILTKADAARTGGPADERQKLQGWLMGAINESRQARKLMLFLGAQDGSTVGTYRQNNKCLICGSDQHSFCYRLLDYEKVELQEIPIDDPELTCLRLTNGTCYPPGCCGGAPGNPTGGTGGRLMAPQRIVVVFVLGGNAQKITQEKQAFVKVVAESVEQALTSSSRLTIKTKSPRPY